MPPLAERSRVEMLLAARRAQDRITAEALADHDANASVPLLDAALYYARRGWQVLPVYEVDAHGACACRRPNCPHPGKHPRPVHGVKDATTDLAIIRTWWRQWPWANIGIATGQVSGLLVLDIDGQEGMASLKALEIVTTPVVVTGRETGLHVYLAAPTQAVGNSVRKLPGLDVRSSGGYVVAPPSRHASGVRYRWHIGPDYPVAFTPQHVLQRLGASAGVRGVPEIIESTDWSALLRGASEGQRHQVAARLAGRFFGLGRDAAEVEALLLGYASQCTPPHDPEDIKRIVRDLAAKDAAKGRRHHEPPRPVLTRLADVASEEVHWLWTGRIAEGKLHLLMGDPGMGKSTLTLDIAARFTRGAPWPDGSDAPSGTVLMLGTEDGIADTIRPRLEGLAGDAERVTVLEAIKERGAERPFSLSRDLPHLQAAVLETGAKLVIIDPLNAYLGAVDSYRDSDVRQLLAPLTKFASEYRVALIAIAHLTKDGNRRALYRAQGSIAFAASARLVAVVGDHPDEPDQRVFVFAKSNLAALPPALAFTLGDKPPLTWLAGVVEGVDADTVLGGRRPDEGETKIDSAKTLIQEILAGGEAPAIRVLAKAKTAGFSESTLSRAAKQLGVDRIRRGGLGSAGAWYWRLPSSAPGPAEGEF